MSDRRDAATHALCAAALGISTDAFRRQVDLERAVGYHDGDAVGTAYLHIADPKFGCGVPGGADPANPLRAAAYRRSPRRQRDADEHLRAGLADLGEGGRWEDYVLSRIKYRLPVLRDKIVAKRAAARGIKLAEALAELRLERLRALAIDSAAWALHPGGRSKDRKARSSYRQQMIARYGLAKPPQRNCPRRASVGGAHGQMALVGADWGASE